MRTFKIIVASILLFAPMVSSSAALVVFNSIMTGEAANAGEGTGSLGTGAATMTLDTDSNEFTWLVAWQNLSAPVTVAHFHGPADPDENAGVQVTIDAASNPSIGSAILTNDQADQLLNGLWYINIHSENFPAGEIRGQVLAVTAVPLPAAFWLFGTAMFGLVGLRRSRSNR